jgi:hypothetical protein
MMDCRKQLRHNWDKQPSQVLVSLHNFDNAAYALQLSASLYVDPVDEAEHNTPVYRFQDGSKFVITSIPGPGCKLLLLDCQRCLQ